MRFHSISNDSRKSHGHCIKASSSGQAADAVSAYTEVKMKMHQRYAKIQSQHFQIVGYVYRRTNGSNHDLGEPTSFLDHEYLGCTQRECKIRNETVANYRDIFESRISAGAKEKLPTRASGKLDGETTSSWHGRSCTEMRGKILRTCEQNDSTVTQSRNAMHG